MTAAGAGREEKSESPEDFEPNNTEQDREYSHLVPLLTQYAQLDNGYWYLLEEDGGFMHMTDREFKDFLAWNMDRNQREEEDDEIKDVEMEEESDDDDEELLAEFHAAEEAPDPSLEMLNSEVEEIKSELERIDPELRDSK